MPLFRGGNATLYVSDMDRAVAFYTETLELTLENRYGDSWASIDAGGMSLGLHPAAAESRGAAERGSAGTIEIGLRVDRPLAEVIAVLKSRGVELVDVPEDPEAEVRLVRFRDPDGNGLYLFAPWS
jgi:catechol 2,3-dioxygenase-like lactoylglutathione lyase family enzyme